MAVSNYKDLIVWQKSMDLALNVYKIVKLLPREERYSLSDQMRRAVVSIPSNIAEGKQRSTAKEYKYFLHIAKGSLCELETQLLLCEGFGYLQKRDLDPIISQCDEIGKMLTILISRL